MLSLRYLKAMILIVGILAIVFGIIAVFQADEAEAHRYTWTEIFMGGSPTNHHKEKRTTWTETRSVTFTWKSNCTVCSGKNTVTNKTTEKRLEDYEKKWTDHYSFSGVYLENCHRHNKTFTGNTVTRNTTTSCSNSHAYISPSMTLPESG